MRVHMSIEDQLRAMHLSALFLRELLLEIGLSDYLEACARNANRKGSKACHSHDFCDANMVMSAAWELVFAREFDRESARQNEIWYLGWSLALVQMQEQARS